MAKGVRTFFSFAWRKLVLPLELQGLTAGNVVNVKSIFVPLWLVWKVIVLWRGEDSVELVATIGSYIPEK